MRCAAALLLLSIGCTDSSLTTSGALDVTAITPDHVSARGGMKVVVSGRGLGGVGSITVRGVAVSGLEATEEAVTFVMPSIAAGPAPITLLSGGEETKAGPVITVEPLPLAFSEAPSWLLPTLAGPVHGLVPVDLDADAKPEVVVGTKEGVRKLSFNAAGAVVAEPLAIAEQTNGVAVTALASDPVDGLLAACVEDATTPIRLVGKGFRAEAIEAPVACTRLVFVEVDARARRWLFAQTSTGLSAWRFQADHYAAVELAIPALPGPLVAAIAADLDGDGDESLVLAGAGWLRVVSFTKPDGKLTASLDEPFPPVSGVRALAAFDADLDGDADLLVSGDGSDALFINDGHGRYFDDAWRMLPFERSSGVAVAAGDVDLDGRTDLVIATAGAPDRLFLSGLSGFSDRTPTLGLATAGTSSAVLLADLDRDGDLDVLTLDGATGALRVRLLVTPEATP